MKYTDYIVISKKDIEDKIEVLEKEIDKITLIKTNNKFEDEVLMAKWAAATNKIKFYKEILSNSKPLPPIVEDALQLSEITLAQIEPDFNIVSERGKLFRQSYDINKKEYLNRDIEL